ncbi:alpha/beta hydrolase, partial [Actinopolymorpha pittospori]|uniref:alpha/beta fold hydrolase n=1 Tax=Actinopolymorpha pittospori TaxID=648752 RepID=UPI0031F00D3D
EHLPKPSPSVTNHGIWARANYGERHHHGDDLMSEHSVDVGGRRLHVVSHGQGAPTVLFEAGLGCSAKDWALIQARVGQVTASYSYDRAGEGASDESGPWSVQGWLSDLESWLDALSAPGPYVLVGHSIGGHVVRTFAARHPEEVAGLVLVDAQPERLYDDWTPDRLRHVRELNPPGIFDRILEACEFVKAATRPMSCPLTVITHGVIDLIQEEPGVTAADVDRFEQSWQTFQMDLAKQSALGRLVVAEASGHMVPTQAPDLIADEILAMVAQIHE